MVTVFMYLERARNWTNGAALLISSIRKRVRQDEVKFEILIDSDASPRTVRVDDGCRIVRSRPFGIYPAFNKIRIVEQASELGATNILLLDHDLIAGPAIHRILKPGQRVFAAVENSKSQLESTFGTRVRSFINSNCGKSVDNFQYFNSGVVSMNLIAAEKLAEVWPTIARAAVTELRFDSRARPFGNLSLSVAAATMGVNLMSYSPEYNQRNFGDLSDDPVLIHYSNWDEDNIEFKRSHLLDLHRAHTYIQESGNRFWKKYRNDFIDVLDDAETTELANTLWDFGST
jgi:hypothetical protein